MAVKKESAAKLNGAPKKGAKKSSHRHPTNTEVDEVSRFVGTVLFFDKQRGYGFVKPAKSGLVPDDRVMVHWKEISSDDRWPFLHKNLQVEFNLKKRVVQSGCIIQAKKVTLPGLESINLQEASEEKMHFIHSQGTRFTGEVKFYNMEKGYGFVTLEDGYAGVEDVPRDLRIVRAQINSATESPFLRSGLKVEFGIMKTRTSYACFNLSMPGGDPVTRIEVEQRKLEGSATYSGTIVFLTKQGTGYIKPESILKFPASIQGMMADAKQRAVSRLTKAGKESQIEKLDSYVYFRRSDVSSEKKFGKPGTPVTFQLYSDNVGVGACQVQIKA